MTEKNETSWLWVPAAMEDWRRELDRASVHALLKADMERATEEMEDALAKEMYRASSPLEPLPAPTWRQRWKIRLWPVRRYLQTVWWAVRGDALDHERDEEEC